ncbi:hypothetical protein ACN20G_01040 [Streptomyces sp. BI20]|uniref:hypothetical protein n=1 Tax=Streptomyces sp. BI20 TaxID=3403460 RepID=UPI003C768D23
MTTAETTEAADPTAPPPVTPTVHNTYNYNASNGNINAGTVHGDQATDNQWSADPDPARRPRVHEGPIPRAEVEEAIRGFAVPTWWPEAKEALAQRVVFLAGEPGSGRHTAGLNLLHEHCRDVTALRAVDNVPLDTWRPKDRDARGYLMEGHFPDGPDGPIGPGALGHLRALLEEADSVLVITLVDDPHMLRALARDLRIAPVRCVPPAPDRVFTSVFEARVRHASERARLLSAVPIGLLDTLLDSRLIPSDVVELVRTIISADGARDRLEDLAERVGHRSEEGVSELVTLLHDSPEALAFLVATAVFEGLDHRIVREQADRLLALSDGALSSVLQPSPDSGGAARPNPDFALRHSLASLLVAITARCGAAEVRTTGTYPHRVEPVTFIRHRRAESVLRHIWREYGQFATMLTSWLRDVPPYMELTEPVGRVMGMAAGWGGGRQALHHITDLAGSERVTGRQIAAHALGIAAEDPVLVGEVRHKLAGWTRSPDPRLRSTVALACGSEFGLARPDLAVDLLGKLVSHAGADPAHPAGDVARALHRLHRAGFEEAVFDRVHAWSGDPAHESTGLGLLAGLMHSPDWFARQLAEDTVRGDRFVTLLHRALDSDPVFDATSRALLTWCDDASRDDGLAAVLPDLLTRLSRSPSRGTLRLFVELERREKADPRARDIARAVMSAWREEGGARHGG